MLIIHPYHDIKWSKYKHDVMGLEYNNGLHSPTDTSGFEKIARLQGQITPKAKQFRRYEGLTSFVDCFYDVSAYIGILMVNRGNNDRIRLYKHSPSGLTHLNQQYSPGIKQMIRTDSRLDEHWQHYSEIQLCENQMLVLPASTIFGRYPFEVSIKTAEQSIVQYFFFD
jgi:hypothetical protein